MKYKTRSKYTPEQRLQIIQEYESGSSTTNEVAQKYGLKSGNIIVIWRKRLRESSKRITFAPVDGTNAVVANPMEEKTKAQLEAELAQVKKDLEWARLQNLALNTMIDIAEENGIRIRKKSGAKQ